MIPKRIHYCWFGGNPLDEISQRCIASWKTYFPDYEIIQWDESNFDITQMKFMEQAYRAKKWAFVSDVARLLVIYQHGGIYFDTDVEVVRSFDPILRRSPNGFLAYEKLKCISTGLGYAMPEKHPLLEELLSVYEALDFDEYKDQLGDIACPILTTALLQKYGYVPEDRMQHIFEVDIYPSEYFSPLDYISGTLHKTQNTYSIHWYNASWNDVQQKQYRYLEQRCVRILGTHLGEIAAGLINSVRQEGISHYLRRHFFTRRNS